MPPTRSKRASAYHHGDLRQAVLEVASRQPDLESLSLREVATAVGVTAAALYRHFDSREALLDELAAGGFFALQQRFEAVSPLDLPPRTAKTAVARFSRLGAAYLTFADDEPALWRLMFGTHAARYRANRSLAPQPSSFAYLEAALAGLHHTGVLANLPEPMDRLFAWSTIHGAAALRVGQVPTAMTPPEVLAAQLVHRILDGLRAR